MMLATSPSHAQREDPTVTCDACVVTDGSGDVLWERASREQLANASTTKMVTALVAVEQTDLDQQVTVSANAAATSGGLFELGAGETYSVEELLEALLLASSNDAAVALAEHVSGSEDAFVSEMNDLAARIGARETNFVTSHGLDTAGHYSTALDLARIGRELLENSTLARIVALDKTMIEGSGEAELVENSNELIGEYLGAVGIKTGMTALAGDVLVAAARRAGVLLVAVAMRSEDASQDGAALLEHGFGRAAEITRAAAVKLLSISQTSLVRLGQASVAPLGSP